MKYFQCPEHVLDRASNLRTLISPKAQETTEGILKALWSPKSTPMTTPPVNYKPESNATFFLYLPVLREILCVNLRRSKPSLSVGPLTPSPISRDHPISPPPARLMGVWPENAVLGLASPPLTIRSSKCFQVIRKVRLRGFRRKVGSKHISFSTEQGHILWDVVSFLSDAQMGYGQERMSFGLLAKKNKPLSVGRNDCGFKRGLR